MSHPYCTCHGWINADGTGGYEQCALCKAGVQIRMVEADEATWEKIKEIARRQSVISNS